MNTTIRPPPTTKRVSDLELLSSAIWPFPQQVVPYLPDVSPNLPNLSSNLSPNFSLSLDLAPHQLREDIDCFSVISDSPLITLNTSLIVLNAPLIVLNALPEFGEATFYLLLNPV